MGISGFAYSKTLLFLAMNTTIAIVNLGCSKNQVDGERILHLFTASGYSHTENLDEADIIIVNTCAFIREAKEEAIETILESAHYKKSAKCSKLIVSGCFSEQYRNEVKGKFPEVDLWVGVNDWNEIFENQFGSLNHSEFKRELSEPISTQYLKIAEGCSHRCAYCVIPTIRGPFKSRTPQTIIDEAKWLYEKGTRELILVAQDTSFYGRDISSSLHELLSKLLDETSFQWIRMMYLHPKFVTDDLLDLIASNERLCSYFDIPLQHIADPILTAMKRTPLSADTYKLIERIRTKVPDSAIRSSFILGFPGETERHFNELQKFIEFAKFDKLGVFPFSPEEGTAAFDMHPRPRNATVARRCDEILLQQREISREILASKIGKKIPVIIDRVSENFDFNYDGRSQHDAPEVDGKVLIRNGNLEPGTIQNVTIIDADDYDLYGEITI